MYDFGNANHKSNRTIWAQYDLEEFMDRRMTSAALSELSRAEVGKNDKYLGGFTDVLVESTAGKRERR